MKKTIIFIAVALMVSTFSMSASAYQRWVSAKVLRILIDDKDYGHCMALLHTSHPACGGGRANWVTFSCDGKYNPSVIGYQKLDFAKTIVGTPVWAAFLVESSKRANGYCYARRIDLLRTK